MNGSSKVNPGENSNGFCVIGIQGNLVYAETQSTGNTTNIEAEITAIWKALSYCKRCGITNAILETYSLSLKYYEMILTTSHYEVIPKHFGILN